VACLDIRRMHMVVTARRTSLGCGDRGMMAEDWRVENRGWARGRTALTGVDRVEWSKRVRGALEVAL